MKRQKNREEIHLVERCLVSSYTRQEISNVILYLDTFQRRMINGPRFTQRSEMGKGDNIH